MLKRYTPFAAAAFAVSLAFPLHAEGPNLSTVVASVNGEDITIGHVAVAKASLPEQYQSLPADVLFRGILDQLINQTALKQSFEGELPARVVLSLDNESRSLIAAEVVETILNNAVTEESVNALYAEKYLNADPGLEYNAAHILVESEEDAKEIHQSLIDGADFGQKAREKSTGPSGPRGGDLGWFTTGVMVPAFEAAVLELKPGEISDPVQTQFGWHIVKLMDVRKSDAPALEDVRAELEAEVRDTTLQNRIQALVSESEVDKSGADAIDPEILNEIDLTNLP